MNFSLKLPALAVVIGALPLSATVTAPCSSVGNYRTSTGTSASVSSIPIVSATHTYCVTAFGWSDTWFAGPPLTAYDPNKDVYSGELAFNLRYGGPLTQTNLGWLTPFMDQGTTAPRRTESSTTRFQWNVVQDVIVVGNTATSIIKHAQSGIQISFLTTLVGNTVHKQLDIENTSNNIYTDFLLAAYFNLHPNGSQGAAQKTQGITQIQGNCIQTTGNQSLTSFRSNGYFCADQAPDMVATGYASGGPTNLWAEVAAASYNGVYTAVGPADSAGAFAYRLGTVVPGQRLTFNTVEGLGMVPVPEPGSMVLMGLGGGVLVVLRKRRI